MNEVVDMTNIDSSSDEEDDDEEHSTFKLLVMGEPTPKPSVRFSYKYLGMHKGGTPKIKQWAYNPAKKEMLALRKKAEEQFKKQITNGGKPPLFPTGGVTLKVWFCQRPCIEHFIDGDRSKPDLHLTECFNGGFSDVLMPDTDNCLKFLLDALSSVAWRDDCQVVHITAWKCIDTIAPYLGRTIVEITDKVDISLFPTWSIRDTEL